ncbi:hypothetical protein SAMN04489731_10544 [Amycolatopsis regifaucium]|nr:hypothetical protein SAMN04489731_10544 [Amycolatopsis regifaucium]
MAEPRKVIDGVRDFRTQDERYGDAFTDYVRLKTTNRNLPGQAGEVTHILATMSYEDLISDLDETQLDLVGPLETDGVVGAEVRVGGCAFPRCDMPVPPCTAHHIIF